MANTTSRDYHAIFESPYLAPLLPSKPVLALRPRHPAPVPQRDRVRTYRRVHQSRRSSAGCTSSSLGDASAAESVSRAVSTAAATVAARVPIYPSLTGRTIQPRAASSRLRPSRQTSTIGIRSASGKRCNSSSNASNKSRTVSCDKGSALGALGIFLRQEVHKAVASRLVRAFWATR